jgi:hypothetical protein
MITAEAYEHKIRIREYGHKKDRAIEYIITTKAREHQINFVFRYHKSAQHTRLKFAETFGADRKLISTIIKKRREKERAMALVRSLAYGMRVSYKAEKHRTNKRY